MQVEEVSLKFPSSIIWGYKQEWQHIIDLKQECIIKREGRVSHSVYRSSLARVRDLSVVVIHECETACATASTSSAAYVSQSILYTNHKRVLYLREDGYQCYSDLFTPTSPLLNFAQGWYTSAILSLSLIMHSWCKLWVKIQNFYRDLKVDWRTEAELTVACSCIIIPRVLIIHYWPSLEIQLCTNFGYQLQV